MLNSLDQYIDGNYQEKHQDWHLGDAIHKVNDIKFSVKSLLATESKEHLKIADVGAGVGGVLFELTQWLHRDYPKLSVEAIAFEISPFAVQKGREIFPTLDLRQELLQNTQDIFDLVLLIDVLEHLENPWEMLRTVHQKSRYMIVRQPLLENVSNFRHRNYHHEREHWGHISYFNYYSFLDMAQATGWQPLAIALLPSWELSQNAHHKPPVLNQFLTQFNRPIASYLLSGFYLNGIFCHAKI